MNDENDKPKNQPDEDDWSMTMPHQRLDKALEADDFSGEYTPKYNAPNQQPVDDDWGMTTPNINISPQSQPPASDFDKTTPNISIPQDIYDAQKSSTNAPPSQPADDWSMTKPNVTAEDLYLQKGEKRDSWEMPQPTFRVSSGTKATPETPQGQPDIFGTSSPKMDFSAPEGDEDFSSGQTTPYFRISEEKQADEGQAPVSASVPPQASMPSAASPAVQPAKKKTSVLPFILGGVFILLFLGAALLAGVYYMFLRQPEVTRVLPAIEEKSENVSLSNTSGSTDSPPSQTTSQPTLPQEINHKGTMLLIPAGEFTMGSDASEDEAAKPAHKVTLPAFYIDKYEVTNAQYKEFCDATGKSYPPDFLEEGYFLKRPNAPVVGISFADAKAYAEWAGKRLPTEEEWEKAASWNEKTQTKFEFPWGSDFQNGKAAFNLPTIADVGYFSADTSPYGVMDMAGNVLEWVDAYYLPYPNNTTDNPNYGEKNRIVRGGFFKAPDAKWLKMTKRTYAPPDTSSSEDEKSLKIPPIGFRCAVSADDSRLKDLLQSK